MKRTRFLLSIFGMALLCACTAQAEKPKEEADAGKPPSEVSESIASESAKPEDGLARPVDIPKENIRPVSMHASYAWDPFNLEETKKNGTELIFAEVTVDRIAMGVYEEASGNSELPLTAVSIRDVRLLEGEGVSRLPDTVYYWGGLVSVADWDRHQEALGRPKKDFINYDALSPEETEHIYYSFATEEDYALSEGERLVLALSYDSSLGRYLIVGPTGAAAFQVEEGTASTSSTGGATVLRNIMRPDVTYTVGQEGEKER